jgi:hypothetical protein
MISRAESHKHPKRIIQLRQGRRFRNLEDPVDFCIVSAEFPIIPFAYKEQPAHTLPELITILYPHIRIMAAPCDLVGLGNEALTVAR